MSLLLSLDNESALLALEVQVTGGDRLPGMTGYTQSPDYPISITHIQATQVGGHASNLRCLLRHRLRDQPRTF